MANYFVRVRVPRLKSSFKMIYESTHPGHFCSWKYPGRPKRPLIQTLARSKFQLAHLLVQKSFWKDPSRPKKHMIQTSARSSYEMTVITWCVYVARSKKFLACVCLNLPYPLCAFKKDLRHKRGQMKTSTWDTIPAR